MHQCRASTKEAVNLNPKQRFQKNAILAKAHLEWCASDSAHIALEAAFAQFAGTLPMAINPVQSADRHQQLQGARDFISILLNLSEPQAERKQTRGDNLPTPTPKTKE